MRKLLYWTIIIGAFILGILLLRPYFTALIFAAVFAYLLYPAYKRMSKHMPEKASATILTLGLVIAMVCVLAIGLNFIITEFSKAYLFITDLKLPVELSASSEVIGGNLKQVLSMGFMRVLEGTTDFLSKLPHVLLSMFIFFTSFFYFLVDGKKIIKGIKRHAPVSHERGKRMWNEIELYLHSFFYVWLIIAVIQGFVAALGFYIFGLPYPLLIGLTAAILSIIPILGPYLIYVPTGIGLILTGNTTTGLGILIYGLVIASMLDYVARPYFSGKKAKVHPLIVLLGIFGGLTLIGLGGIIIGPILLMGAIAVLKHAKIRAYDSSL